MTPLLFTTLCLSVCLLATTICGVPMGEGQCYALNSNPYLKFGPSTSYYIARRKEGITKPIGCNARQLWMIARHGTRYPDPEDFGGLVKLGELKEQVLANHNKHKRGSLCQLDLDNLEKFTFDLPQDMAGHLTMSGKQELFALGRQVRTAFPEIFTDRKYAKDAFRFLHTPLERTNESAGYFYRGLFDQKFDSNDLPQFEENRNLIFTYPKCTVWEEYGAVIKDMRHKFMTGNEIKSLQQSVSTRLGFEPPLKIGQIMDIFDGCRLNAAFNPGKTSPWCAAFTEDDLKYLEYLVDAYYYHKSGPASELNRKLSCPAIKDLMDTFGKTVSHGSGQKLVGSFYFAHHTMIDTINLGLHTTRDTTAPTFTNYETQKNRQYRTTKIMPFTGNMLAVLYQCPSNKMKMVFYQNEHIVEYPGCSGYGECDFDFIRKKLNSFVNNPACTDRSWCFKKESGGSKSLLGDKGGKIMNKELIKKPTVVYGALAGLTLLLGAGWLFAKNMF